MCNVIHTHTTCMKGMKVESRGIKSAVNENRKNVFLSQRGWPSNDEKFQGRVRKCNNAQRPNNPPVTYDT